MDYREYREALRARLGAPVLAFEEAEYRDRRERVARRMDAAGLEALVITAPADICYLCGYSTFEVSVHCALVLAGGRTVLQVPSIETGPAVTSSLVDEVIGYRWEAEGEAVEQLAEAVTGLAGDSGARVGVQTWSPSLRVGIHAGLLERLTSSTLEDAAGLVGDVKIVKSPAELDVLKESGWLAGLGLDAATEAVAADAQDSDVAQAGAAAMLGAGSEFMSMQPIVTTGRWSSVIHANHRRRRIEHGELVFMEFGAAYHRYTAPMMRTAVAGRATDDMRRVYDACCRIFEAVASHAQPGEAFEAAAEAGHRALQPVADEVFFSGVFGYTVGAQFPPSWVEGTGFIARGESRRFEENMVFHLPICLRAPGRWGIGMSDTIRIGANGGEALTANRWELVEKV